MRFFKVEMASLGWGLLMNTGTDAEPKFQLVMRGPESWMERMASQMNFEDEVKMGKAGQARRAEADVSTMGLGSGGPPILEVSPERLRGLAKG